MICKCQASRALDLNLRDLLLKVEEAVAKGQQEEEIPERCPTKHAQYVQEGDDKCQARSPPQSQQGTRCPHPGLVTQLGLQRTNANPVKPEASKRRKAKTRSPAGQSSRGPAKVDRLAPQGTRA